MIVTYIGGPLHGTHKKTDDLPNRIWVDNPDGTKFLYELRQQGGSGVGNRPIIWTHATYGPVGISMTEFLELSRDIYPPEDIDDA